MLDQLDQVYGPIGLLEYTSTNEKYFVAFNKEGDKGVHKMDKVAEKWGEGGYFNEAPTMDGYVELESEVAPAQPTSNEDVASASETSSAGDAAATAEATTIDVFDHSTGNSSDSDHQDLFVEDDAEFESEVHEEDINLRAKRRTYQRRKRRERIPNDPGEIPLG
ncbi:hypothetical protein FXO38_31342 [Capsicum annuum]|uniref:Uncharacterized protein n=1 Tax=Capsicum annuum TaxID=4072 RepID=A0A2G2ZW55_CAPAN|nr:hypothetical protein FXO38_31342 [Capsicum annuum]KAF3647111.1 hypothetical protein FXO37_20133 [Capsicum annuum]PHT86198.1 hypothetical protein T459_08304 [Capsicum annuum]